MKGSSGQQPIRHIIKSLTPYLFALGYGILFPCAALLVASTRPLSHLLRTLNSWLWERLTVLALIFPFKESGIPSWVMGADFVWTALVMGFILAVNASRWGWPGVFISPAAGVVSWLSFKRALFGHYYKLAGFWSFDWIDGAEVLLILVNFIAGILLGFLLVHPCRRLTAGKRK